MSFGRAEGQTRQWQDAHIKPVPDDENRLDHRIFVGAESRRDVGARMTQFVNDVSSVDKQRMIVLTHGFALTFLIAACLRVPPMHMDFCEFRASPGGVTHLSENAQFGNRVLNGFNDMSYVGG